MKIIDIYKYKRDDGGMTISPIKPSGEYEPMYRIVADKDMAVTKDGVTLTSCIDVYNTDGWYEVEMSKDDGDNEKETENGHHRTHRSLSSILKRK